MNPNTTPAFVTRSPVRPPALSTASTRKQFPGIAEKTFRHFLRGICAILLSISNSRAQTPDGFNPNANGSPYSLALQADGKILVGGSFTTMDGAARNRIARLNADGSLDTGFNPNASSEVYCLVVQADGKILMSGSFTTVGGVLRNRIARLNADGSLDTGFNPNASSTIYSPAVQADGKILLGGAFTTVGGVARNRFARLNADGSLDTGFNPNVNGKVAALALQADGKILMGGEFTTVGGLTRNRIARLNTDGSRDTGFNPNANSTVDSLAVQAGGMVLIGGAFTAVGGLTRNRIARLNADGSLDTGFNPDASPWVYSLALQADGKILMGGLFTTVGGVRRNGIARLPNNIAATQTLAVTGTNQIDWTRGGSAPEIVQVTFETWNGSAWLPHGSATRVAGGWRSMTGLSLPASAWVRARGRSAGGYNNGSSGIIEQIAPYGSGSFPDIAVTVDGTTLVQGAATVDFGAAESGAPGIARTFTITNAGDAPLDGLAVNIDGTSTAAFTVVSPEVATLAPGASTTFTVEFSAVGSLELFAVGNLDILAQLTIASNDWDESPFNIGLRGTGIYPDFAFNPDASRVISLGLQADGKILIGGWFTTVSGLTRNHIARLNADGSLDTGFNPNADSAVVSLTVQADGKILMGGWFTTVGGVARNNIARLNANGSLDTGFNPNASDLVHCLAVQADGKILMSGSFTSVGGMARNRIARLHADGSLDPGFNPDASSDVVALALQADGKILMGGEFTTVGGVARNRIARLNADGSLDTGFNPNVNGRVVTLALQADGKILVGGFFGTVGGVARACIARLNADGSLDAGFNPNSDGWVDSLAVQADGKILMGGYFFTVGGTTRNSIARLNADGSLDTGFNPNVNTDVYSVALQADGRILIGGAFTAVGGVRRNCIARLPNNIAAMQTLAVTGTSQIDWTRSGSAPEVVQVTFDFWNGSAWLPQGSATRVAGGWRMTGLNLPASAWVRARGLSTGDSFNGSSGIIEQIATYGSGSFPDIAVANGAANHLTSGKALIEFGSRVVGDPAVEPSTFTIRNTGTATLTSLAVTKDGPDEGAFTIGELGATALAPGESTTFSVAFSPRAEGAALAAIHIASNDADENPFDINLTGTGAASALQTWRQTNFGTTANTGDAADLNDFDRDGIPNLLEFAFGLNPKQNSAGLLPQAQTTGSNLVITFAQPAGVSGITYGAEWSQTLREWEDVPDTGISPQHAFSVPIDTKPQLYMRLKVSSP
ncbi:MAG: choice-of-anchor D domain-containing protein [Verrucomicrobia bacterium]|nr:choice-of-anchor D domain-containing protein [Verrucomicrobiota bacterium]